MLKVVIDTNVIASATIVKDSNPGKILKAWQEGQIEIIISPSILKEMGRVLFYEKIRKKSWMTEEEIKTLLDDLTDLCIPTSLNLKVVKEHPADNKFIIAAIEGKADYVITGDRHLLNLKTYQGIKIITPADFLKILKGKGF